MSHPPQQPVSALLVDYGEVICHPQPSEAVEAMAGTAGLDVGTFRRRYWQHRTAYDLGLSPARYWSLVLGASVPEDRLRELARLDLEGWTHLNEHTLELLRRSHAAGLSISLLSNAPYDLAARLSVEPALAFFDHLVFSSRLGVAKPDRAAFDGALDLMARAPGEVLFIDDRPENVAGARDAGLRGVVFRSAAQLRDEIARADEEAAVS